MSFQINALSTTEILTELRRRKASEVEQLRTKIAEHKQAIQDLEAKLALVVEPKNGRSKRGE